MALTIIGFLIGAALGTRFDVLIVIPSIGLALLGTAAVGIAHGDPIGSMVLTMVLIGTTLQLGYLVGVVLRPVLASIGIRNVHMPRKFAHSAGQQSVSSFKSLDVRDHMDVVGPDGEHVGTVDHKEIADLSFRSRMTRKPAADRISSR
jgi:uncharacterized protein DUF2171